MFTGIIEALGHIAEIKNEGNNRHFLIDSPLAGELRIDQSLAHDGVCLTVVAVEGDRHQVTAVEETVTKTDLGSWEVGRTVNLERALKVNSRLDGHIVQGHVDTVGVCRSIEPKDGSHVFRFSFPAQFAALIIEKGSVCLNGVSLTTFDCSNDAFSVAIIPYTFEHTNFFDMKIGDRVHIEFDLLGKYILRNQQLART